ncbi:MAG: SpoIID/LytB domain-containing protein [Ignavibacteriales bacterium]|nr:SpoIID/LytB domain-containing protein [Ignavibacteriales bacterium]
MNEPLVSIGILSEKEIRFDLYGEFTLKGSDKKFSGRFKAKLSGDKISICQEKNEIISADELLFNPNDLETESFLLRDVVIGKGFHWQSKENQRFRGRLKFIKEKDQITAVNILPLEEYLTSVISSEMSANSSIELLKAHSIVSRGWLLAQQEKKNKQAVNEQISDEEIIRWYDREDHTNYDFCADDHCQRYQGVTKIISDNALNAIASTRGLVLKYKDTICDTRYSKCCGGMTESFENVWEPELHPYLPSIVDYKFELDGKETDLTEEKFAERWIRSNPNSFCNTSDKKILSQILLDFDRPTNDFFRWNVEYTQDEIAELIRIKSGIDFGNIIDLIPIERGYSTRIIKLKIIGTKKTITIGKELEIRKILSKTHLYSSAFVVIKENIVKGVPQKIILHGAGWGHGVGLCQIGAAVMGELGYGFDEILTHYFNGAQIQKIY